MTTQGQVRHGRVAGYFRVLRHGPASRPFAASVVGRLPIAMAPIGVILLVRQELGSYAAAGLVAGAFAVGTALGGPWWAARSDRLGQSRVLLTTSLLSAVLLAALAVSAIERGGLPLLVAEAALAGATFPPLGPAMRATWLSALDDPSLHPVAFALDAVAVESMFVGGPLLVTVTLALAPPVVPLLLTAVLLAGGGTAYALSRAVRVPGPRTDRLASAAGSQQGGRPGAGGRGGMALLRSRGVAAVLAVTTAVSVGFGQLDTSLAATARQVLHDPGRVGILFTAIAGGSVIGGLVYGSLGPSTHEHRRLTVALGVFAGGLVPLDLLLLSGRTDLWALMPLLFVAGLGIAPSLIITQNLMGHLTSADRVSEAQAWLATAGTAGSAVGTAVAGLLVDRLGLGWSFASATGAIVAGSVVSGLSRDRWTLARGSAGQPR